MAISCGNRWQLAPSVAMDDTPADIRCLGVGSSVGVNLSLIAL